MGDVVGGVVVLRLALLFVEFITFLPLLFLRPFLHSEAVSPLPLFLTLYDLAEGSDGLRPEDGADGDVVVAFPVVGDLMSEAAEAVFEAAPTTTPSEALIWGTKLLLCACLEITFPANEGRKEGRNQYLIICRYSLFIGMNAFLVIVKRIISLYSKGVASPII